MSTTKVRITFTVEADLQAWMNEYGIDTRREAQADMNLLAREMMLSHIEELHLDGTDWIDAWPVDQPTPEPGVDRDGNTIPIGLGPPWAHERNDT